MPPLAVAPPVVLTIAGFDPSSGAGTTADIKTIAAHGCYGVACITALTVQSTQGVKRVQPIAGELVRQTLQEIAADVHIAAVRIGMLGSATAAQAVADFLPTLPSCIVVLDPILKASSGMELLEKKGIEILAKRLLGLATVVTPDVEEAAALTGMQVTTIEQMKAAALQLHQLGARNVVVTGGHLDKAVDLLSMNSEGKYQQIEFTSDRLRSNSTHGTGCAFATALAANLALGKELQDAVVRTKAYVKQGIAHAYPLGHGVGSIHHLYRMDEQPRSAKDIAPAKGAAEGGD